MQLSGVLNAALLRNIGGQRVFMQSDMNRKSGFKKVKFQADGGAREFDM